MWSVPNKMFLMYEAYSKCSLMYDNVRVCAFGLELVKQKMNNCNSSFFGEQEWTKKFF